MDSGSGLHACPRSFGEDFPLETTEPEPARTATGAPVDHFGARTVTFLFPDGSKGQTRFNVMGVAISVLSVSELNRTGHTVTLAPEYATITRAGRSLNLVPHNGVFYLPAKLEPSVRTGRR